VQNVIRQQFGPVSRVTESYYYLGMAYLLNMEPAYRDTTKAIEMMKKYVDQSTHPTIEYALARAELRRLGIQM
jgi:hypothetical protein